jgi:hypothetical protein
VFRGVSRAQRRKLRVSPRRPRNDLGQYDDLVHEWWKPEGAFAALHRLAAARKSLIPPPGNSAALLVDVGCGAGLMADAALGYVHVGVDLELGPLCRSDKHQREGQARPRSLLGRHSIGLRKPFDSRRLVCGRGPDLADSGSSDRNVHRVTICQLGQCVRRGVGLAWPCPRPSSAVKR